MDLVGSNQVGIEILESVKFDLFIASSGFEERCTWLVSNYTIVADKKIALASAKKHYEIFKAGKNKIFKEKGFDLLNVGLDENSDLLSFLEKFAAKNNHRELNILVDYSGMTKVWFYSILNFFAHLENMDNEIHIYYSYTPVHYIKSKKPKSIRAAESIVSNAKILNSEKPKVLIIGLGLEAGKAEYIKELIKPDKTILLYADPAPKEYVDLIFSNNKNVISEIDMRNMINYPLKNLNETMDILTNLILELRMQSNIILAPLGPKSLSLISMILNIQYPDVDIWRISSNLHTSDLKQQALLSPLILKLKFSGYEEE
ncbi:MAG: hypothetical protein K9H12_07170 [Bacteroidales bacterium]|nr:hypothetical protein [Bacteroidales bacterium]